VLALSKELSTPLPCFILFLIKTKSKVTMARLGMLQLQETETWFVANSKYKIQALFKDFQGPKLHFSSTKIMDKKPYPRHGHSKFRQQCDTEVYCTVLTNTVMIKASDRLQSSMFAIHIEILLQNC